MPADNLTRFLRAGVLTGVTDGLFASVLTTLYGATVMRLWQGVAATLIGPSAFDAGARGAALGVLLHFNVAFAWSAVFLYLVTQSAWLRRVVSSRYGVIKVAAVYGPFIWLVMSFVVIPVLVQRPPVIAPRWWIQLVGHFPFVALPMVAAIKAGAPEVHAASSSV